MLVRHGTILVSATLAALASLPVAERWPFADRAAAAAQQPAHSVLVACGGRRGGFISTEAVDLVYATRSDTSGVELEAAILVRAPAEWRRLPPGQTRPDLRQPNGSPRLLAGATAGPLWIQHEQDGNTLWLDDQPISLGEANVILLEAGRDGPPRVVTTARVAPRLSLVGWSCPRTPSTAVEQDEFNRALWDAVRQAPAARAFLDH